MALTDNIVAYWKLDESSGNASDSVGSVTLTNTGSTYVAGKINNGISFGSSSDNTNTMVNGSVGGALLNLANGSAKSISFWIKANANPNTGNNRCIDFRRSSTSAGELSINYFQSGSDYQFSFYVNGGTLTAYVANLSVGTWYHFVMTVDSSDNITVYLNNSSVRTGTWGSAGSGSNFTQVGGANGSSGSFCAPVAIDEFGCWNKELDSGEVSELYNGGMGLQYPFPSLVKGGTLSMMGV